jgi:DNA repair protein SbcC/Rad50
MLPVRLELHNFLAYRTPAPIKFDGLNLACLSGPNGAGKSSLLDAMTWAIWGQARAKTDDELIHMGQEDMHVIFDFRQDHTLYRVVRKRSKKGRGQGALDLFVFDEELNQFRLISESTMRDTQNRITQILRLDYTTFVHSAFLQQGRADAFTIATPGERKKILAEILGLARWDQYEKASKEALKQVEDDLRVINLRIADIDREEANEPTLRSELENATAQVEQAQQNREVAEAALAEVAGAQAALQSTQTQLTTTQRQIRAAEQNLASLDADINQQRQRIETYQEIIASRDTIETGYAQWESARQANDEMGEKLSQQAAMKDQLNDLQRELDSERATLESQAAILVSRISDSEKIIADGDSLTVEMDRLAVQLEALEQRKAERETLVQLRETLNVETAERNTQNVTLRLEMDDIVKRLEMVKVADGALCPVCRQPLDEEHIEELQAQYKADGTSRGDQFRANEARVKEIKTILVGNEKTIKEIDLELRDIDSIRAQEGGLQERYRAMQDAAQQLGTDQAALDELRGVIEREDFAHHLREQIATLQAEIDGLGYDRDLHTEARNAIKSFSGFEVQMRELEAATTHLPDLEARVDGLVAQHARISEQWTTLCSEADTLQKDLESLNQMVEESKRRQAEVLRLKALERNAVEKQISIQQQLSAIDAARKRKQELLTQRESAQGNQVVYEQLREAFSKNGVPAMIIEAAIPELEEATNRILTRMTDGRMNVRFDTQKENKTGTVRETLDINISDELGTREYGMFSGGEGFRVNFALRIALSQFLARRAGARLQTLVIDEGFGSQDDIGRERLVEAINAIKGDFDLILIVTHLDDLRDAFPVHIEVRKTRDGATAIVV